MLRVALTRLGFARVRACAAVQTLGLNDDVTMTSRCRQVRSRSFAVGEWMRRREAAARYHLQKRQQRQRYGVPWVYPSRLLGQLYLLHRRCRAPVVRSRDQQCASLRVARVRTRRLRVYGKRETIRTEYVVYIGHTRGVIILFGRGCQPWVAGWSGGNGLANMCTSMPRLCPYKF